ncbi:MAG TPA: glutathione S-transferase family protein [Alphaproteobacteria bacterium]|nr:glutathione S-transferase family protein [Alphaproteobacteria bacterium]
MSDEISDPPILFHDPTSEPSRAVHWFSLQASIPLRLRYIWLTRNEHLGPQLLAVNPRHQVPALQHGGFCLSEATAIIRYLAEIAGNPARWLGDTPCERARINQLLSWYHTNLRLRGTLEYFLPVLLAPSYLGQSAPQHDQVVVLRGRVREVLDQIEQFLEPGPFLAGDRMTAPDFMLASEIFALDCDPDREHYLTDLPRLSS